MAAPRPKVQVTFHPEAPALAEDTQQLTAPADPIATTIAPGARWFFASMALMVLAISTAAPALNGKFLPQDGAHVTENTALRLWQGLIPIWRTPQRMDGPYPITFTSYLLQYKLFGDSPTGYRVVSLLLHGVVALLLWTLFRKLDLPGAWFAAALFAVHPVQIAAVAWIAQQKVLLCAIFYLSALLLYFRYCGINPNVAQADDDYRSFVPRLPQSRPLLYVLAMLLLMLALASQAIAVTFVPVVVVAIWWERARITRRDLIPLLLPAIITMIAAVCFALVEFRHGAHGSSYPSALQRTQLLGHALWFDLFTVLAPVRLSYVYPRWALHAAAVWQYLPTLAAVGAILSLWKLRRRLGRGPFAAAVLFAILVLPYAGIVNFRWMQQSYVGDHLLYLASAVPLIAIATTLSQIVPDLLARWKIPLIARPVIAGVAIAMLLAVSVARAGDYRDRKSLWTATLARNPRFVTAHIALGVIAMEKDNNTAAAFRHFTTALEIDDENADTHLHLARLYDATGQIDLAVGEYYQVLRRAPNHPDAHFGLALILGRQGDSRAAIQAYQRVLAIKPDHKLAYLNLGRLHEERIEIDEAIRCYREAIAIDPRSVEARLNLGLLLYRVGQINEALEQTKMVIEKVDPRNYKAYFNYAAMHGTLAKVLTDPLQKRETYERAAEYFRIATILDRESADAFCQRGLVLMQHSQLESREPALRLIDEAITCFRRALDLKPDHQDSRQYERDAVAERGWRHSMKDERLPGR